MTEIRCPLLESAEISRHEIAVIVGDQRLLYHELDELATRVARNLALMGVRAGDRVGLFLPADARYVAILFGLLRLRAVACPLNTRWPRAAVLDQLRRLGARHVVAYVGTAGAADLAAFTVLPPDDLLIYREDGPGEDGWRVDLDAHATILATSGSAGTPKAVVHTYGNHYYSARGANVLVRLASRDRWLVGLPLYHVGGLGILFRCILAGGTMVFPETDEGTAQAQERHGVTHLSLVATQLYRLLHAPDVPASFASVKAILLGGSAAGPGLLAEAYRRKWPVLPSYGLTEMASQVCTMPPNAPPAKRMTSGQVLRHRQLRISGAGEIEVRGETLFAGYWENGALHRPLTADGWLPTGDLGSLDTEGYLTVTGRRDRMLISGGENIQPEEVERLLASLDGVEEAVVVAVPDAEFGERPVAILRWGGPALPDAVLKERLGAALPRFKIPEAFLAWPAAVESGSSKPNLDELARWARKMLSRG